MNALLLAAMLLSPDDPTAVEATAKYHECLAAMSERLASGPDTAETVAEVVLYRCAGWRDMATAKINAVPRPEAMQRLVDESIAEQAAADRQRVLAFIVAARARAAKALAR